MNPTLDKAISIFRKTAANPLSVSPLIAEILIRYTSSSDEKYAFKLTLENSANTQLGLERLEKLRIPTLLVLAS